ncbi:hypothetical protein NODU109028_07235 [Nocardioides dubius]|uniref:Uncharacterized protein n=1 Tax=Nocardioides dubius TaxID=317019 RepID=A0ABN1TYP2_9ACTN
MTDFEEPRTEIEWSRRAIINVVEVLAAHAASLTLVGAHAVLLRTMALDVPRMPTGDGDLGVTPGLVSATPRIETLLVDAGYRHRTSARPGLWGRTVFADQDGSLSFREKVDLLAPHGLSGTVSRSKRGAPALQPDHGKHTVGNVLGLELASFNRSLVTLSDFADPRLTTALHVADIPALVLAKGSKIGERIDHPRKGRVRDKDLGDLWRLMAVGDPADTARVVEEYADHPQIGVHVRQGLAWTAAVVRDPVSRQRAKSNFDTFVDPREIDNAFARWQAALAGIGA